MYKQGTPYLSRSTWTGTWRRKDLYIPTGEYDCLFVAGPNDNSPVHTGGMHTYDPSCSCCWLNFAHSEECHKQKLS